MRYSIVVAVYNRPDEMDELLASLVGQTFKDFEVVVVEDGSAVPSKDVCERYQGSLRISYHIKQNSGPGPSRNYGCRRATGDYVVFIDSDCMAPPHWLASIDAAVRAHGYDAFGGPDREHPSFSVTQKAISYAMTSMLTTGGIRGKQVRTGGAFHPRSFNMGMSLEVFHATDGFARMRFGEDVDLSIRIIRAGFKTGLIPDAWVYHKRRTDLKKFFKQVHNSGIARINLTLRHPGTLKLTHFFPAAFTSFVAIAIIYAVFIPNGHYGLLPLAAYLASILIGGSVHYRSPTVGVACVAASVVQLIGYGTGFISGLVRRIILGKPEGHAFEKTFYR
ncbi:MAG: glycosyltransferase [Candidatus Kapabacteria bacterium]|nr:glycosyltransferase [Candidatus Kapabacteria bacterium]